MSTEDVESRATCWIWKPLSTEEGSFDILQVIVTVPFLDDCVNDTEPETPDSPTRTATAWDGVNNFAVGSPSRTLLVYDGTYSFTNSVQKTKMTTTIAAAAR